VYETLKWVIRCHYSNPHPQHQRLTHRSERRRCSVRWSPVTARNIDIIEISIAMSISRFIDNRVTRTTLIALAVILLDLNPRMSTSARLLPESFTKGKYSAIIYYIICWFSSILYHCRKVILTEAAARALVWALYALLVCLLIVLSCHMIHERGAAAKQAADHKTAKYREQRNLKKTHSFFPIAVLRVCLSDCYV